MRSSGKVGVVVDGFQISHVYVLLAAPLNTGNVPEPGADSISAELPSGKHAVVQKVLKYDVKLNSMPSDPAGKDERPTRQISTFLEIKQER